MRQPLTFLIKLSCEIYNDYLFIVCDVEVGVLDEGSHSVGIVKVHSYTEMHPGANSVNKPRKCSKCDYVFVTFEPWANPDITDKLYQ